MLHRDDFLDTYRLVLGRLQAACGSGYLEGVYTSQWFESTADRPVREVTIEMAYGSDGNREKHALIRRDQASTPYFERVFLPQGGRMLWLERLDPARPFYIRLISDPDEDPDSLVLNDRRDKIARASYSIGDGYLVPAILGLPSFQITELGSVERDGASLVRAAFKFQTHSVDAKSIPDMDGWLLLDPARDWRLWHRKSAWLGRPSRITTLS